MATINIKKNIKITYIILTWNSEKYITNCLDSIFNIETINNYVIVVDNGSTDNTPLLLRNYKVKTPTISNLKVITFDKNYGTTKSRNIGLDNVEIDTNYVCILDSDTRINEKALSLLISNIDAEEGIGIIGPRMANSKGIFQTSARRFPTLTIKLCKAFPIRRIQFIGERLENYEFSNRKNYDVDYLVSACWLMKYDISKKIGKFDEKIFYAPEDVDYCMKTHQLGYRVVFCPKAKIIHEWQRISKKKLISKMNYEHLKGLIYYFYKYKYIFNSNKARGRR